MTRQPPSYGRPGWHMKRTQRGGSHPKNSGTEGCNQYNQSDISLSCGSHVDDNQAYGSSTRPLILPIYLSVKH